MKVFAVVVAYHPKQGELESLCRALRRGGSSVVVVDNSEGNAPASSSELGGITVVALGENTGIAHGFNVGIEHALSRGAEVVVLLDQDSTITDGFLSALLSPLTSGEPGVVAPVAIDKRNGVEYPAQRLTRRGYPVDVYAGGRSGPFAVDLVISSGCAATAATFMEVGLMDEDFFIDFVDLEWCLRCRSKHVPILVVPAAVLPHAVGERMVKLGAFRSIVHGPARTYYKIRNAFLLFRKRHVPVVFALQRLAAAIVHNLMQVAVVDEKRLYLGTFFVAVMHGLSGVTGKRPAA
jgi:rhamnosyltransferase